MPVRNQNWYDLQAGRRYPLDDRSTGLDDAGEFLRDSLIVDCHLKFPEAYGNYAFISGITVTANIVTVVISASDSLVAGSSKIIAAVSVAKPLTTNTNYPLQGIVDGVAGWIAFGPGVSDNFVGRYSTPIQTLIAPRNGRPYREMPVKTLRKYGVQEKLQNIVNIAAQAPVFAEYAQVEILGKTANAIVLSLRGNTQNLDYEPLQYFLGPCGARPESDTCAKSPILAINGVTPDCNGNIEIVFDAGLSGYLFDGCGGIAIGAPIGLADACAKEDPKIGGADECAPSSSSQSSSSSGTISESSSSSSADSTSSSATTTSSSSSSAVCLTLPLCLPLLNDNGLTARAGVFYTETRTAPETCDSGVPTTNTISRNVLRSSLVTGTNLLILDNCASDWALDHRVSAVLQLGGGARRNGGVVLNYLTPAQAGGANHKYLTATINLETAAFQLFRYNGSTLVNEFTALFEDYDFSFDPTAWYVVSITPMLLDPGQLNSDVVVFCELKKLGEATPDISFSVTVDEYGPIMGSVGLFSNQAYTYFSHLFIET